MKLYLKVYMIVINYLGLSATDTLDLSKSHLIILSMNGVSIIFPIEYCVVIYIYHLLLYSTITMI